MIGNFARSVDFDAVKSGLTNEFQLPAAIGKKCGMHKSRIGTTLNGLRALGLIESRVVKTGAGYSTIKTEYRLKQPAAQPPQPAAQPKKQKTLAPVLSR